LAAAPELWFYHLERSGVDEALPPLLDKTLKRGWRALVRTPLAERLEALDSLLWTWRDDAWLPHGPDGAEDSARQPILLSAALSNANAAQAVFLLDGAGRGDLEGVERVVSLFDGRDPDALAAAREAWRAAKAEGMALSYWRQSEGGQWSRQA
jgi:DNA polymerase III subunit chi